MTILPSITSTLSHWNPLCCHILFYKIKNKMPVWQITDYIFTAAANLLLGGYTSALTISISIIRNRLMIKKKMTKTILSILIILRTIVGSLSQSTWGYWLFANHLFSLL